MNQDRVVYCGKTSALQFLNVGGRSSLANAEEVVLRMKDAVPEPVITISADQICCELNGQAVILSLTTGQYYGLDEVGSRVWALIQEPRTMSELQAVLLTEFDVEPSVCHQDLNNLINELRSVGLIQIGV